MRKLKSNLSSKSTSIALAAFVAALLSGNALSVHSAFADEPPFAQWVTMATRVEWNGCGPALSPSGELFVSAAVDSQLAEDPARPGGGPYEVFTEALLGFDRDGRILNTNRLVGVTGEQTAFDADGNRYLTGSFDTNGYFSGCVTSTNYLFDPAEVHGFFLAKYSPDGQLLWVRSQALGDNPTMSNRGKVIAQDPAGNLVVGINSDGEMTLGNIQLGAGSGPVIAKYDRDGQVLWARRIADAGDVRGLGVDTTGHIVLCGSLPEGVVDFGGTTVYPGSTGLSYGGDWYLARLTPTGDLDWVKLGYATSLAIAKSGDIYATFDWAKDVYGVGLARFRSTGDLVWSKTMPTGVLRVVGIALDPNDEPVFTGSFDSNIQLDGIALKPRSTGWEDILLAKTDGEGSIRWAMSGGGPEWDVGERVLCDTQGNIFLTGQARKNNGSFDGLPLIPIPIPPNSGYFSTLFVAKLNPAPRLRIASNSVAPVVSWPARATNYVLEAATSVSATSWDAVTNLPTVGATECSVQLPITGAAKFFRLHRP